MELYYLGVLVNTLALSVITSYIFYYITVTVPYKHKMMVMKPTVEQSQKKLAELLNFLFGLLTKKEDWKCLDNKSLKASIDSESSTRTIWLEEYPGIFKTPEVLLLYNPYTLTAIGYTLNDIQKEIAEILQHGEYFEEEYLNRIIWIINTDTYKKLFGLRLNSPEQINIDRQKIEFINGTTYLDNFFREELSLRLFENKDGKIFIDEIRKTCLF